MSDKEASKNSQPVKRDNDKKETANASENTNSHVNTNLSYSSTTSSTTKPSTTKETKPENSPAKQADKSAVTKKPLASKPSSTPNDKVQAKSTAPKNTANSKTAITALVIASISVLASAGHYIWQQQQTSAQLLSLSQQNQQAIQQSTAQLKNNLTTEFNRQLQLQHNATKQSQKNAKQAHFDSDTQIQQLAAQLSSLEEQVSQSDPSDWLIHEAEYLIRIAARTMWLERDTRAAISLLRDADNRLKELNHPKFLPVRALINEDIENLALMPVLTNQEAILSLMALNKQIPTLTLAGVNLAEALDEPQEDFILSDDINDWQENLARTWRKFIKDFITVRRRTGMVEPLMSPEQQQHLRQNLSLKVQLVQWAASEQKNDIYQQTLLDIQQWLNEFFDMGLATNKNFYNAIEKLKAQTIYYDYPSDLRSLTAIKRLLKSTMQGKQPKPLKSKTNTTENSKNQTMPSKAVTTIPDSKKVSGGQL